MRFADTTRSRPFAKDPAVVRFQGTYWLYYSVPPFGDGRTPDGWGIGIATSADLTNWQRVGELAQEQPYEQRGFCAPGAIVYNEQIHLFYQTYGNGRHDSICHATSTDGLHFTRNPTNPIFAPTGDWTSGRAIDADVIRAGDQMLLYYATRDPEMQIQMLGVAAAPADSAFNREDWVQQTNDTILRPELPWEQLCIEAPAVCRRNNQLYMFYAGAYNNCPQQVGCARSQDGITWERLSDTPFLPNGAPGSWNSSESGHPFIFVDHDDRTYLFFQGNDDHGKTWYLSNVEVGWNDDGPFLLSQP